jgi:hypothetical protein
MIGGSDGVRRHAMPRSRDFKEGHSPKHRVLGGSVGRNQTNAAEKRYSKGRKKQERQSAEFWKGLKAKQKAERNKKYVEDATGWRDQPFRSTSTPPCLL